MNRQKGEANKQGFCIRLDDDGQHGYIVQRARNITLRIDGKRVPVLALTAWPTPPVERLLDVESARSLMHQIAKMIQKAAVSRPKRAIHTGLRYTDEDDTGIPYVSADEQVSLTFEVVLIEEVSVEWSETRPHGGSHE